MEKIKICKYWKDNKCNFMENSSKCQFAHGMEDINMIICKYGSKCYKNNCLFDHGKPSISYMIYDIPIIDKRKKEKK